MKSFLFMLAIGGVVVFLAQPSNSHGIRTNEEKTGGNDDGKPFFIGGRAYHNLAEFAHSGSQQAEV